MLQELELQPLQPRGDRTWDFAEGPELGKEI